MEFILESANNFRNINLYGVSGKVRIFYKSKNGKVTQDQKDLSKYFNPFKVNNKDRAKEDLENVFSGLDPDYGSVKPMIMYIPNNDKVCIMITNEKIIKECEYILGLCFKRTIKGRTAGDARYTYLGITKQKINDILQNR